MTPETKEKTSIREATLTDAPSIAAVHVAAWKKTYNEQIPEEFLNRLNIDKYTWNWESWLAYPSTPEARTWVVVYDDRIVGFAGVGPCRDDDMDLGDAMEIHGIYFHPDIWRLGLGRALMQWIFDDLRRRDYNLLTLWTLEANKRARSFYESLGMTADGETKVDFKDGFELDEIRYTITL